MGNDVQFRFNRPDASVTARLTTYNVADLKHTGGPGNYFGTGQKYDFFPFTVAARRSYAVPAFLMPEADDWGWGIYKADQVNFETGVFTGYDYAYPEYDVSVDSLELDPGEYVLYIVNYKGNATTFPTVTIPDVLQSLTVQRGRWITFPALNLLYDKFGNLWGHVNSTGALTVLGSLSAGATSRAPGKNSFSTGRGQAEGDHSVAFGSGKTSGIYTFALGGGSHARTQMVQARGGYNQTAPSTGFGYNQTQTVQFGIRAASAASFGTDLVMIGRNRIATVEGIMSMRRASDGLTKVVRVSAVVKSAANGAVTVLSPVYTTLHVDAGAEGWVFAVNGFASGPDTSQIGLTFQADTLVNFGGEFAVSELY